jgi:hypothetical protein
MKKVGPDVPKGPKSIPVPFIAVIAGPGDFFGGCGSLDKKK